MGYNYPMQGILRFKHMQMVHTLYCVMIPEYANKHKNQTKFDSLEDTNLAVAMTC